MTSTCATGFKSTVGTHTSINEGTLRMDVNMDNQVVNGAHHINAEVDILIVLEEQVETQELSWVVEFKMNGLVRKNSSR